jgi:hypothetical protein
MALTVLIPLFDDWQCLPRLLQDLHAALQSAGTTANVVVVDDGSPTPAPDLATMRTGLGAVLSLQVVELNRNVGQERAIAVGLCHVQAQRPTDAIAVMDADGEDPPAALPQLLGRLRDSGGDIVLASRRRRHEPVWFRIFYQAFKAGFRLATGQRLDHGHFSLLSPAAAERLVQMHELWVSYSAAVLVCRLPLQRLGVDRGSRYFGSSHMNVVGLIVHGMRAASVFLEQIYVRAVLLLGLVSAVAAVVIVTALALKMVDNASPGWASNLIATSSVIVILSMLLVVSLMAILRGNSELALRPNRHYREFIRAIRGDGATTAP